jgi:hypothetical protein
MPAQAILAFDQFPADPSVGFELGWDHAHYNLVPPPAHLTAADPLRHGWLAGRAAFGARTLRPTRQVRKWLQLRLNAWRRGRTFDNFGVTPRLLAQIEVDVCPIIGEVLTHATGTPTDASVDRVNNNAGYALGNLAVMSVRANQAKAGYAWDDALAFVRQIENGGLDAIDGLSARQWARLGVLMSFCTPLKHEEAACLPLLLVPPARLRVLNAVQALQVLLTLQFTRPGHARRIAELAASVPAGEVRHAFLVFMHTLLARRIAAGRLGDSRTMRRAMEDAWSDELVNRRWQRLSLHLTEKECERLVRLADKRGLAGPSARRLEPSVATDGWALETAGYASSAAPLRPVPMRRCASTEAAGRVGAAQARETQSSPCL